MSDLNTVPTPRPRRSPQPEADLEIIQEVSSTLSAFNKNVSFLGEGLNEVQKSFTSTDGPSNRRSPQRTMYVDGVDHTKVYPRRRSLLDYGGATGAAAVYLGELLTKSKKGAEEDKDGVLSSALGTGAGVAVAQGLRGGIRSLFTPKNLLRLGGGALFAGLTLHDFITAGLPEFQKGDIIGGIVNTLLGKPPESDAEAGLNILKQTGKWAGFGLMVAGPIGGAIAGGIGLLVSGIRSALIQGWDKETEQTSEEVRDIFMNPEKYGFWESLKIYFAGIGKNFFGVLASGVREWWNNIITRLTNIWDIMQTDKDASLWEKLTAPFRAFWEFIRIGFAPEVGGAVFESIKNALIGLLPDQTQNVLRGLWGKVQEFTFEKGQMAKTLIRNLSGRLGNVVTTIGEGIGGFLMGAWERVNIGSTVRQAFSNVTSAIFGEGSPGDWVYNNIIKPIGDFIAPAIRGATDIAARVGVWTEGNIITPVSEFFTNVKNWITGAFEDVVGFIRENLIFPVKDFFFQIATFFRGLTSGIDFRALVRGEGIGGAVIGDEREKAAREAIMSAAQRAGMTMAPGEDLSDVSRRLREAGHYVPRITDIQDAIIRPDGDIIRTAPDDTLVALRNVSSAMDNQAASELRAMREERARAESIFQSGMSSAIRSLEHGLTQRRGETGNQVLQQNFTSRFSPVNIMSTLSATEAL